MKIPCISNYKMGCEINLFFIIISFKSNYTSQLRTFMLLIQTIWIFYSAIPTWFFQEMHERKMEKFAWIKPFTFWNVLLCKNCRDFGENKNWFETQQSSGTVQQSMCVAALILKWHYSTLQMSCFLCDIHDAINSKRVWIKFFVTQSIQ